MLSKSTMLTILASAGVIGTAVATAKAVPKAQKKIAEAESRKGSELTTKEKFQVSADCYVQPMLIGAGTIACTLGANVLNKKHQASLISSYAVLEQCYKHYRNTLVDLHGPAADEEVREHMVSDHVELQRAQYDLMRTDVRTPDALVRWYEPISKQWFTAYEREVMDAEYHLNRNYSLEGAADVNDLLYFLNIPDMGDKGTRLIWDMCVEELMWIDFQHLSAEDENGVYYIVSAVYDPIDVDSDEWREYFE